jgi:hypothetical protein
LTVNRFIGLNLILGSLTVLTVNRFIGLNFILQIYNIYLNLPNLKPYLEPLQITQYLKLSKLKLGYVKYIPYLCSG